ncbi:hypothetical protein [Achromobacter aloeverae]
MNLPDALLLVLGLACVVLAMAQMADLGPARLGVLALALAAMLVLTGASASRTSVAELGQWLALPQRRLDLAALLLVEALVFGSQAVTAAQGRAALRWRLLGAVPPPSLLIALFLAQVWAMLAIDGIDFDVLAWICAVVFAALFAGGAVLLRAALPDPLMRTGLRLLLHAVQVAAGLWLARPAQPAQPQPTPAMWDRLALLAALVLALAALGWLAQRWRAGR